MSREPLPLNSLGELICPGCGAHLPPRVDGRGRQRVYCSGVCRKRASRMRRARRRNEHRAPE